MLVLSKRYLDFRAIFRAHDLCSPRARAKERFRRVALTSVTTFAAKGAQISAGLISVPPHVALSGAERNVKLSASDHANALRPSGPGSFVYQHGR